MSNTFLQQLYIASAVAFCTQPIWGLENTNFDSNQDKECQKLIQLEQSISQKISENISRGMAILHISKVSEANYGLYIPQETVYHIIATFYRTCYDGPLYHSLEGKSLEDRHLLNFKFPQFVTCMTLQSNITNEGIKLFTNLTSLKLVKNPQITDEGIKPLAKLTHLSLYRIPQIMDEGVKLLTNLTSLDLVLTPQITNEGIKPLTKLAYLSLYHIPQITDEGTKLLPNLIKLLRSEARYTNKALDILYG